MKVDTWSVLASAVAVVALVFGLMLAFRGYEWRKKRARLIDAVALVVLVSGAMHQWRRNQKSLQSAGTS